MSGPGKRPEIERGRSDQLTQARVCAVAADGNISN
jgi:hypothetical protein